ncbi:hypothetical protein J1605_022005 [Eschrichtius robustus]|uniref:Uncharacterized protein n=1 Tax=Eschrichtius robustus TaxID=9764 RepID=A0AB34HE03_ESCRO|nr:hypothetical protein J1605_022005 [Eschrichtius robustus]
MVSSGRKALRPEEIPSPVATSHMVNSFGEKTLSQNWSLINHDVDDLRLDSRNNQQVIKALRPASSPQGSYREPEKLCSSPKATQHVDLRPSLTASTKGHEVLAELRLRECPETLRSRRATRFPDPADPHYLDQEPGRAKVGS